MRVDHAHAVRADHRHSISATDLEEPLLAVDPRPADFPEAGGDHDEPLDSLPAALLRGFEGAIGGNRDDREIHGIGNLNDTRIRPDAMDAGCVRIHGIEGALK